MAPRIKPVLKMAAYNIEYQRMMINQFPTDSTMMALYLQEESTDTFEGTPLAPSEYTLAERSENQPLMLPVILWGSHASVG